MTANEHANDHANEHRPIRLSVLDLVPITSGSTAADAIANTIDLARHGEAAGYHRHWVAEHHLNPGVAGTSPALIIALIANGTTSIRVGSGAVLMGHHTPLSVVEQFGIIDAVHPGRIDLGLGRSGSRQFLAERSANGAANSAAPTPAAPRDAHRTNGGLLIPAPYSFAHLLSSPRAALQIALLQQPNATTPKYAEQIDDVLSLIAGTYHADNGEQAHVIPGEGAELEVWILGSSGSESAIVAGERGLPFAANYHVTPSAVLEAVGAYREAFRPSASLDRPWVAVSADVVVGDDDAHARELATGYATWVRSIRSGEGAIPFPSPAEARLHVWTDADRTMVQDRLDTQYVGSASHVADQLSVLASETGANELLITTITHDHRDRVRSYELLATEWANRRSLVAAR